MSFELCTVLIDFYAKCGCTKDAQEICCRMPDKDVTAYSFTIVRLTVDGDNNLGPQLFTKLEKKEPEQNAMTFIGILILAIMKLR